MTKVAVIELRAFNSTRPGSSGNDPKNSSSKASSDMKVLGRLSCSSHGDSAAAHGLLRETAPNPVIRKRLPAMLPMITAIMISTVMSSCTEDTAMPSIVGMNYSSHAISTFLVNDYDGANVPAHGGGGKFVCCIAIPRRWRHGLTAKVQWTEDEGDPAKWHEAVVAIPRYQSNETSYFAVHFYRDETVKVLVTNISYLHPNYPLPEPSS